MAKKKVTEKKIQKIRKDDGGNKTLIRCSSVTFYQAVKCGNKSENTVTNQMAGHRQTIMLWCPEDMVFIVDNKDWKEPTIAGIVNVRHFVVDRSEVMEYYKHHKAFSDDQEEGREEIMKRLDDLGVKYNKKLGKVQLEDLLAQVDVEDDEE